jgi:hypothetical protein
MKGNGIYIWYKDSVPFLAEVAGVGIGGLVSTEILFSGI